MSKILSTEEEAYLHHFRCAVESGKSWGRDSDDLDIYGEVVYTDGQFQVRKDDRGYIYAIHVTKDDGAMVTEIYREMMWWNRGFRAVL